MTFSLTLCLFLSLSFTSLAQLHTSSCPLLGPDFPAPVNPSGSRAVIQAQELTAIAIQQALLNTTIYGSLDSNATSFSLQAYSLYESDPLFTYHFAAPALAEPIEGVATVDTNTIYRIASISKLLTAYTYLITAGDSSFNDPITKYVPELAQYAHTVANV
jgi:Beta-lactamase